AHCGYEATAAQAMMDHPLQAAMIAWKGIQTEGPMAPEIDMSAQRPAQYVFDSNVQLTVSQMRANEAREKAAKNAAKDASRTSASAA
ncbi:MAG: hopanoid biosynthesis associated radical SAM protein HpnH, partial [Xanthobacteraceae bacterium]